MQTQQLQQHQHPQQQQFQKAPNNQMFPNQSIGQTTPGGSAVTVIDSDEEDDIMQVNQQPMQFNPVSNKSILFSKLSSFKPQIISCVTEPPINK